MPHQRLLLKLKAHDVINWIEKWLTHRRQRVIVDGEISNWKSVLSRVTQRLVSVSSGLLQTAQTWANAGVCGGLCACAVGGTFD